MSTLQPAPGVVPLARVRHTFLGSGLPGALSRALPGDSFVRNSLAMACARRASSSYAMASSETALHGRPRRRWREEVLLVQGLYGPYVLGVCAFWPGGQRDCPLLPSASLSPFPHPPPGKLWVSGCSLAGGISFLSSVV